MLRVEKISKKLPGGKNLLEDITFTLSKGEFIGLLGPSGAGKTLTMRCINGLTRPTSGHVWLENRNECFDLTRCSRQHLKAARQKMGMIFQGFNLVKESDVLKNVMVGRLGAINPWRSLLVGFTDQEAQMAYDALARVHIETLAFRKTGSLSGGEMQRVAIARALMQQPLILLADEPIANLDPGNAKKIMQILKNLSREIPVAGIFHQPEIAVKYCTRILAIKNGHLVYDGPPVLSQELLADVYGKEYLETHESLEKADHKNKVAI